MLLLTASAARADASRVRLERGSRRGYDELFVLTPVELAALILGVAGVGEQRSRLRAGARPGERFAMLLERIDELSLERHDFGGQRQRPARAGSSAGSTGCKADLVGAEDYAALGGAARSDSDGTAGTRRSSRSSPRCIASTSGCWPRRALATPAT